ncbi:hypothetical protein SCLCIDRAFT_834283 [Scleroderma citrinum Foug A]|uniref:Uncharacterized protein n=1 Tax=Scleroderma citrinum Foug A TaxID=1036808 RepID=A0A0C3E1C9_9AGAM|nr:hypothetical protein SCLCIDRAFT_834283 [Scleroderma citrinum Foug A]
MRCSIRQSCSPHPVRRRRRRRQRSRCTVALLPSIGPGFHGPRSPFRNPCLSSHASCADPSTVVTAADSIISEYMYLCHRSVFISILFRVEEESVALMSHRPKLRTRTSWSIFQSPRHQSPHPLVPVSLRTTVTFPQKTTTDSSCYQSRHSRQRTG